MICNTIKKLLIAVPLSYAFTSPAFAQNTGGVFGPVVNEGHKSVQYRATLDPDNAAGETGFAQRLHYQQAINNDLMWRIIGATRKTDSSDFDFDFVQAELFWDLTPEDSQPFQTGVRFDARLRDGDRAEQLGFNWMNQWAIGDAWEARALGLTSIEIGDTAADGAALQTRFHLLRRFEGRRSFGLEMFNNYGRTDDVGSFDEQNHTIGPFRPALLVWGLYCI